MYKFEKEYTIGFVLDCVNADMLRIQELAHDAEKERAYVLWSEIQGLSRLAKSLETAVKIASKHLQK